jgi:hypothetical protein
VGAKAEGRKARQCTRCRCRVCRHYRQSVMAGIEAQLACLCSLSDTVKAQSEALKAVGPALMALARGTDGRLDAVIAQGLDTQRTLRDSLKVVADILTDLGPKPMTGTRHPGEN